MKTGTSLYRPLLFYFQFDDLFLVPRLDVFNKQETKDSRYDEQKATELNGQHPVVIQEIGHYTFKAQRSDDLRQYNKKIKDAHIHAHLFMWYRTS